MELSTDQLELLLRIKYSIKNTTEDNWLQLSSLVVYYDCSIEKILHKLNIDFTSEELKYQLFDVGAKRYNVYLGTTPKKELERIAGNENIARELLCLDIINDIGYPSQKRLTAFKNNKLPKVDTPSDELLAIKDKIFKQLFYVGYGTFEKQKTAIDKMLETHFSLTFKAFDITSETKEKIQHAFNKLVVKNRHKLTFATIEKVFQDKWLKGGYFLERLFYFEKLGIYEIDDFYVDVIFDDEVDENIVNKPKRLVTIRKYVEFKRMSQSDIEQILQKTLNVEYILDYTDDFFTLELHRQVDNRINKSWKIHKFIDNNGVTNKLWKAMWSVTEVNVSKLIRQIEQHESIKSKSTSDFLKTMNINGVVRDIFVHQRKDGVNHFLTLSKSATAQDLITKHGIYKIVQLEQFLNKNYSN